MFKQTDKPGDILLRDWLDYINNKIGQEQWLTVYLRNKGEYGACYFFCALIPNSLVEQVLKNESWDLRLGDGMPRCTVSYGPDGEEVRYDRFGNSKGIEPLVLYREFYGIKKNYVEVSEEFRLFHDLYYDKLNNKYIKIDESGAEEDIILIEEDLIRIKLKAIKQFLAIKEMHLAIYFSIDRYSDNILDQLGLKEQSKEVKNDKLSYFFNLSQFEPPFDDDKPTFSRIIGKKLIPGMPKEKSGIWPYEEEEIYEDFIIGIDENGEPLYYTCDPDKLSNDFGKNPDAPHYLTPVFFSRDVLTKYYSKPDIYSVEDGYLRCGGLWGLQIDNNHDKYIVVFLGDLGRDLPKAERTYWKSYNVPPDGTISSVNWKRSFEARFSDPKKADLYFKYYFDIFKKDWYEKYGWYLFKPLHEKDKHYFRILRVPLTNEQHEFDEQILALAKILIDSLNEKEIESQIPGKLPGEIKGISKFEKFLEANKLKNYDEHIKFLRSLWDLRLGVGHRKGDAYKRGADYFKLNEKPLSKVFEDILNHAINLLKYLNDQLIMNTL